jgi:hypothetical protein
MELYKIPRGSKLHIKAAKNDKEPLEWVTATYHRPDGMYSYCTVDGWEQPNTFHLHIATPMKLREDGKYEIETPQ